MDSSKENNQQPNGTAIKSGDRQSGPTVKFWNRLGAAAITLAALGGLALMIWASSGR